MYPVSAAYKAASQAQMREAQTHARIYIGVFDSTASPDAALTFPAKTVYSTPTNVNADATITDSYATFEPKRLRLDGRHTLLPDSAAGYATQGYVSAARSGTDGIFTTPPEIVIAFGVQHTLVGLTLTFDPIDPPPAQLTLLAYTGDTLTTTLTGTPTSKVFQWEALITNADKLILRFDSTAQPQGRARLNRIEFGIGYSYRDNDILTLTERHIGSPICLELPQSSLSFTLSNAARRFDLDGTAALIRFIHEGQPVSVTYGMDLDGSTEWLPSNGWRIETCSANRTQAEFKCTGPIADLSTAVFDKCPYKDTDIGPQNLYAAAELVLNDAGWSKYWLNPALASVPLAVPLPVLPHAQLLQLIAGAAGMQLVIDRTGKLLIDTLLRSPTVTAADNFGSSLPYSDPAATLATGAIAYADFSTDCIRLNGSQLLLGSGDYLDAGWVGNTLSLTDGSFWPNNTQPPHADPSLRYTFDAPTNVQTITLDFSGSIPKKITVRTVLTNSEICEQSFYPVSAVEKYALNISRAASLHICWVQMQQADQRPRLARITISPVSDLDITSADVRDDIQSELCAQARNVLGTKPCYVMDWERPESGGMGSEKYTEYFSGSLPTGSWQRIEHGNTPIYSGYVYSVDAGITAQIKSYAYATYLLLTGTPSSANVVLHGVKTTLSTSTCSLAVSAAGTDCIIGNPLVYDAGALQPVAHYLDQRVKYTIATRGYPELDPLDLVRLNGASCCVLDTELTYNGAFGGKHTLRRWEPYVMADT